jgi:hypothetical protein
MKINGTELTVENWTEVLNPKDLSTDQMIDIMGDIKAEAALLKKAEGYLKEVVPAQFEDEEFEYSTSRFAVTRMGSTRVSLDSAGIKEEMGDEWCADHSRETEFFTLRLKAIE